MRSANEQEQVRLLDRDLLLLGGATKEMNGLPGSVGENLGRRNGSKECWLQENAASVDSVA